jgi:L-histidine Nalpha-methyltransferase
MNGALPQFDLTERNDFLAALLDGLGGLRKSISCKYFYDERGSVLFDEICGLAEYYQTRTELALLHAHCEEIAGLIGPDATLVEFGAGASRKVELILNALERPRAYVPIDISGDFLSAMLQPLRRSRPGLPILPVIDDFMRPIKLPTVGREERRVGFFPGSTIGNLDPPDALSFLESASALLEGGGLLIGVDLVKAPDVLHAAYNDSSGVTAAFNKNVLARANREFGAGFDLDGFSHYAFYDPQKRRIEMHLVSLAAQSVVLAGHRIAFAEGETIHTENSYKYTMEGFRLLAREAGFRPRASWRDADRMFSIHWLESPAGTIR